MTTPSDDAPDRSIELEVEVPGTPEQVWQAIATGPGISAWLQPTEVEPRTGGAFSYDLGLGAGLNRSGTVTGWDPPQRFATETMWQPSSGDLATGIATEWLVAARASGTCVVRMVMTGFATGAGWDEEIEGVAAGMRTALDTLRRYLTHFPGRHAEWIRVSATVEGSSDLAWATLTGSLGVGEAGPAGIQIALYGDGVAAVAAREQPAWEAWMEAR